MASSSSPIVGFGNRAAVTWSWAVLGVICATCCPAFLLDYENRGNKSANDEAVVASYYLGAFTFTILMYFAASKLRGTSFMRPVPRGWMVGMIGNMVVSIITILVTIYRHNTINDIHAQLLVAVAVFGFIEIGRPAVDYGFLQFFLRLPLQTAIICGARKEANVGLEWYVITGFVLAFGTVWNSFYLHIFIKGPEGASNLF